MFTFGTKAGKTKINAQTAQILDLEAQKKRLEFDKEQINLELDNQKKKFDMTLETIRHKQNLEFQEKSAVFEREKKVWETEKQELIDRSKREKEEFENRLQKETEIKLQEATVLNKLDSQQQVKQAELDRDRKISELRTAQAEQLAKVKSDTAEEYYKKMTSAFQDIQTNGTQSTKFVQELALKMFDSAPRGGLRADINVSSNTPALPAPKADSETKSA